jgi:hypothetical protein
MARLALVLTLLLGASGGPEVRTGWIRIEVPDGAPVTAVLLGRGDAWAGAKVDLDGDGRRETTLRPDLDDFGAFAFAFERGGRSWNVDLGAFSVREDLRDPVSVNWIVSDQTGFAFFINGRAKLHRTEEEAVRVPFRPGADLRFTVSAGVRGPDSVLRVSLEDANGCGLRTAEAGDEERRIRVRVLADGEERFAGGPEYG